MKKVTINPTTPEIDWSKPQWVQQDDNYERIVLTTGENEVNAFSGMVLPCLGTPNGEYSQNWAKNRFHLLTEDIPFIISNKD